MKNIFFFLFLVLGLVATAQTDAMMGDYYLKYECESGVIEYKLSLNPDGTYDFHTYNKVGADISEVTDKHESGRWSEKDKVLSFSSKSAKDFDEEYTVNLNGSIARFVSIPSTHISEKESKTGIIFDTSKVYCIEGLEFLKMENPK